MRIAQIAPLIESVPPSLYGGTERIVSYITEDLVRLGHEVTLFASGDSQTAAELVPCAPRSLRLDPDCHDSVAPHLAMLEEVTRQADRFDCIHYHLDQLHLPFTRRHHGRHVTTLHLRMDEPAMARAYGDYQDVPLVSISDAQRRPLPALNWRRTIYHGLPLDLYQLREQPGEYLAFLGRISPDKRCDRAIAIARGAGLPLVIAAKVDRADEEYFRAEIEPLLSQPHVTFDGEIREEQKSDFLGRAVALLFPIDWPEPFGLVMIEAMACGTPAIAFPCGSVPEVIDEGVTGYITSSVDEAVAAVRNVRRMDRRRCREAFERRYSVRRMTEEYVELYRSLAPATATHG